MKIASAHSHNESGYSNFTIFGELREKVQDNITYSFTHVYIGKFKNERIIKTSDVTEIIIIESKTELEVDIEIKDVQVTKHIITCKVVLDTNTIKFTK